MPDGPHSRLPNHRPGRPALRLSGQALNAHPIVMVEQQREQQHRCTAPDIGRPGRTRRVRSPHRADELGQLRAWPRLPFNPRVGLSWASATISPRCANRPKPSHAPGTPAQSGTDKSLIQGHGAVGKESTQARALSAESLHWDTVRSRSAIPISMRGSSRSPACIKLLRCR
jgi:hypothetical protein